MKLAIAGMGNNASALMQGVELYRENPESLSGVKHHYIHGVHVTDVDLVIGFDSDESKVGRPVPVALLESSNTFPLIHALGHLDGVVVQRGITNPEDRAQVEFVSRSLRESGAEVLLYSLPTGRDSMALAYARAAIRSGVHLVNCTPDPMGTHPEVRTAAQAAGVLVVGDDLQSHLGSSVVHGALLELLERRGIDLAGSYQINLGGNADFANLVTNGANKERSKYNALRQRVGDTASVTVVPAGAFVPYLGDQKVAHLQIAGIGWAGTPVRIEVNLAVQDSSNAAGVIIDLVRLAARGPSYDGEVFPIAAGTLLKSPPRTGSKTWLQDSLDALATAADVHE